MEEFDEHSESEPCTTVGASYFYFYLVTIINWYFGPNW